MQWPEVSARQRRARYNPRIARMQIFGEAGNRYWSHIPLWVEEYYNLQSGGHCTGAGESHLRV